MSTRAKIVVLVAIVVLIVGLIVLDRSTRKSASEDQPSAAHQTEAIDETPPSTPNPSNPNSVTPPSAESQNNRNGNGFDITPPPSPSFTPPPTAQGTTGQGTPTPPLSGGNTIQKNLPPQKNFQTPPPASDNGGGFEQEEQNEHYVIKSGDNFSDIAKAKYGSATKWTLIAKANPDVNPNRLKVGQKIVLPALKKGMGPSTPQNVRSNEARGTDFSPKQKSYTTRKGDSLYKIAMKFYKTPSMIDAIFKANQDKLESPNSVPVGITLTLPEKATLATKKRAKVHSSEE